MPILFSTNIDLIDSVSRPLGAGAVCVAGTAYPELIRSPYPSGYGRNTKIGSALVDSNSVAMQNMANGSSQCMKLWWASRLTISGQDFGWRRQSPHE